uniref:Uncharacterized protein n=1 Tax=Octopus bimaculoides TaxID=37653 RepID=A0A0L8IHN4_OCTBM
MKSERGEERDSQIQGRESKNYILGKDKRTKHVYKVDDREQIYERKKEGERELSSQLQRRKHYRRSREELCEGLSEKKEREKELRKED